METEGFSVEWTHNDGIRMKNASRIDASPEACMLALASQNAAIGGVYLWARSDTEAAGRQWRRSRERRPPGGAPPSAAAEPPRTEERPLELDTGRSRAAGTGVRGFGAQHECAYL